MSDSAPPPKPPGYKTVREQIAERRALRAAGVAPAPRVRRERTPEELAALPPSTRRRALLGKSASLAARTNHLVEARAKAASKAAASERQALARLRAEYAPPTKLTADLIEKLVAFRRSGASIESCAGALGIAKTTLYEWMRLGIEDPDSIYGTLANAVARANDQLDVALSAKVVSGKAWQGPAWMLERTVDRARYAPPTTKLEHGGPQGGEIRVVGRRIIEIPERVDDPADDEHPAPSSSGSDPEGSR